ncbi:SDR family NAD(P)-dependent oxidoreductase [Algiphilus sp.]|uniref:SDR family NAD(P)-dependent oxidoreductase n=1 Tax=Algiphilus sp. TaxID=1872431 RepID=UPI0025C20085|nr:SDR family NAD(P)-dependent oxidoreductase [Algiphilus sp.]MCK5770882.1 SDR family NAD(P)-dependent oxidoreductase [Algiphilus sp.]
MSRALPNPLPSDALRGRVLLITGAGAGLGRATALRCARAGATVVLLGRTIAKLEATFDAILALGDVPEPAIYPMDLAGASDRDMHECIDRIVESCGGLHGIVHAAAHWQDFRPMQDVLASDWAGTLATNLNAPWALTRVALETLKTADDGCVVFCDCEPAQQGRAFFGAYGVAKAALREMVAAWTAEQPGVRMHLFDPGPMRTTMRLLGYPGAPPETYPPPESAAEVLSALFDPALGADADRAGQLCWSAAPPPEAAH